MGSFTPGALSSKLTFNSPTVHSVQEQQQQLIISLPPHKNSRRNSITIIIDNQLPVHLDFKGTHTLDTRHPHLEREPHTHTCPISQYN